jgi:hypothetical protein
VFGKLELQEPISNVEAGLLSVFNINIRPYWN